MRIYLFIFCLFIRSGPAALPIGSDFNVSLTSSGVTIIESSLCVCYFSLFEAGLLSFHLTEFVRQRRCSRYLLCPTSVQICYFLFNGGMTTA